MQPRTFAGSCHVSALLFGVPSVSPPKPADDDGTLPPALLQRLTHSVEAGITGGFRIASAAGPLCDEPLCTSVYVYICNVCVHDAVLNH